MNLFHYSKSGRMGPDDTKDDESVPLLIDALQGRSPKKSQSKSSEEGGSSGEILPQQGSGLSLVFATLCIIDLFGVFPIIVLPRAIINCGECE